ncbi:hypothetical protein LWI28_001113 [Acer negundo]|uniref:Uncharacterized protein n=1 Tax=Acer negundo TaxID=4023 RepID=A0AAD5IQD0_ACENE|nr:hypothetical protein LWI28_001113 [Acer negundo]
MAQASQILGLALSGRPISPLASPLIRLLVSPQLILTDSEEDATNDDALPEYPVDQSGMGHMGEATMMVCPIGSTRVGQVTDGCEGASSQARACAASVGRISDVTEVVTSDVLLTDSAVEELNRALISQERQALRISRLKRELAEKNDVLKFASASESKMKRGFEGKLRQWEVTENALRRTLTIAKNKTSTTVENLKELSVMNNQLEVSTAQAKLQSAELESRATLAKKEAAKSAGEA